MMDALESLSRLYAGRERMSSTLRLLSAELRAQSPEQQSPEQQSPGHGARSPEPRAQSNRAQSPEPRARYRSTEKLKDEGKSQFLLLHQQLKFVAQLEKEICLAVVYQIYVCTTHLID